MSGWRAFLFVGLWRAGLATDGLCLLAVTAGQAGLNSKRRSENRLVFFLIRYVLIRCFDVRNARDVSSVKIQKKFLRSRTARRGGASPSTFPLSVRERAFVPSGGDLFRVRTVAECLKRVKILLIFGKSPKKSVVFPLKNIDKIFVGKYDFLIIF